MMRTTSVYQWIADILVCSICQKLAILYFHIQFKNS
jgi:hypothetical protein